MFWAEDSTLASNFWSLRDDKGFTHAQLRFGPLEKGAWIYNDTIGRWERYHPLPESITSLEEAKAWVATIRRML